MTDIKIDEVNLAVELVSGAPAIASILGCTVEHVRRMEKDPRTPIYKPPGSGRYIAYRSELIRWTRTKSTGTRV